MSLYGVDTRRPQFKKNDNDPKNYGRICPHCSRRYGDPNLLGYIEIMRCGTCPTFKDYSEFYAGAKKCAQWKKKR
jgi:hypothetical protein